MRVAHDAPSRPALRWYGGKWRLAPWIISHFPAHKNYVEPCGGAASVLLQKPRSPLETYNDLDGNAVNFFRVLRDQPDELIRKIRLTPWARAEFDVARVPTDDELEEARRFFVSAWMAISGTPHDTDTGMRTMSYFGQSYSAHAHNYADMIMGETLDVIANRFRKVQIENRSYEYVVERYDSPESLIYIDPPYLYETRASINQYHYEWTRGQHEEAADLLRQCEGHVVISGYACPLYADLYEAHGWHRVDREAQTNSGGKRVESLWLSPCTWSALNEKMSGLPLFANGGAR